MILYYETTKAVNIADVVATSMRQVNGTLIMYVCRW